MSHGELYFKSGQIGTNTDCIYRFPIDLAGTKRNSVWCCRSSVIAVRIRFDLTGFKIEFCVCNKPLWFIENLQELLHKHYLYYLLKIYKHWSGFPRFFQKSKSWQTVLKILTSIFEYRQEIGYSSKSTSYDYHNHEGS